MSTFWQSQASCSEKYLCWQCYWLSYASLLEVQVPVSLSTVSYQPELTSSHLLLYLYLMQILRNSKSSFLPTLPDSSFSYYSPSCNSSNTDPSSTNAYLDNTKQVSIYPAYGSSSCTYLLHRMLCLCVDTLWFDLESSSHSHHTFWSLHLSCVSCLFWQLVVVSLLWAQVLSVQSLAQIGSLDPHHSQDLDQEHHYHSQSRYQIWPLVDLQGG